MGRLGNNPEVKTVAEGVAVATCSLATGESYRDKNTGERKESTEWHNLEMWRGLADIAGKYLTKGALVSVEGKLRTKSWEKDGVKNSRTVIVVDNITMLGGKKPEKEAAASVEVEDELPI